MKTELIPAVCENEECNSYKAWNEVEPEEVIHKIGGDYVYCRDCGEKIYL